LMSDVPAGTVDYLIFILPTLLKGAVVTIKLSTTAFTIGLALGLPLAMIRVYGRGFIRGVAMVYIEALRGTPLLVQLFVIYYGLPDLVPALQLDRYTAAFLALGLNSAAYQAEYFRGAIQSINEGQLQAALSVGMTPFQAVRHIVIPQALRLSLPALSNEVAYMLKYTSIVFIIAVPDLMARGKIIIGKHWRAEEVLTAVAVIYIVLVNTAAKAMGFIEDRYRIPGLQTDRPA